MVDRGLACRCSFGDHLGDIGIMDHHTPLTPKPSLCPANAPWREGVGWGSVPFVNPAKLLRSTLNAVRSEGLGAAYAFLHERAAVNWIERPLGISTEGHIPQAGIGRFNGVCLGHIPASYRNLHIALRMARLTEADTLLDYGSGLGRVLIEASRLYPLRRVIGIEYSPELVAECRQNVIGATPRLKCPVEIVEGDAGTLEIPADVTVAFFVNPFHGHVLDAVLEKVRESMRLVTLTPKQGGAELVRQFRDNPRIERIAKRCLIGNAGGWRCQVFTVKETPRPGRS